MGRPRKPVDLRLLEGSYQPSRHGPLPEPEETAPKPVKPAGLTGESGKMWDRLLPLLEPVVRERDTPLLVEMCTWWAELKRVRAALKKSGPGAKGYQQLLVSAGICSDKVDKIASRFGMTPSDRAKLRAEASGPVRAKVPVRPKTALDRLGGGG